MLNRISYGERIEKLREALSKILAVKIRSGEYELRRFTLQDISAIANNALVQDDEDAK